MLHFIYNFNFNSIEDSISNENLLNFKKSVSEKFLLSSSLSSKRMYNVEKSWKQTPILSLIGPN